MGFLSDLFGSAKSSSKSKPAELTPEQLALQKQAVETGKFQVSNIGRQTDFQTNIFAKLMQQLQQRGNTQRSLFGSSAPVNSIGEIRAPQLDGKRNTDLEAFKQQIRDRRTRQSSGLNL